MSAFVYVANAESRTISALRFDVLSGRAKVVAVSHVPGEDGPSPTSMPLTLSPDWRFLYAAVRSPPFPASTFKVNPISGELTFLGSATLGDAMCFVTTDRTGHYLFGASYEGDGLTVNRIARNGCIEDPEIQHIGALPKAHAVLTDQSNRILYATILGRDEILQFAFDAATGVLTPLQSMTFQARTGSGPRHLVEHPAEPFVFVLNELDGSISTYARDSTSNLLAECANVRILQQNFSGIPSAADIHLTPDGKYLYATERTSSTICAFMVTASGQLHSIEILPTEASPRSFAIDPAGCFLVVAGQLSNAVAIYVINPATGRLTFAEQLPMGGNPSWVEIIRLDAVGSV